MIDHPPTDLVQGGTTAMSQGSDLSKQQQLISESAKYPYGIHMVESTRWNLSRNALHHWVDPKRGRAWSFPSLQLPKRKRENKKEKKEGGRKAGTRPWCEQHTAHLESTPCRYYDARMLSKLEVPKPHLEDQSRKRCLRWTSTGSNHLTRAVLIPAVRSTWSSTTCFGASASRSRTSILVGETVSIPYPLLVHKKKRTRSCMLLLHASQIGI